MKVMIRETPKGLSAYIKPKRQVAALFGGKPKTSVEST